MSYRFSEKPYLKTRVQSDRGRSLRSTSGPDTVSVSMHKHTHAHTETGGGKQIFSNKLTFNGGRVFVYSQFSLITG